MAKPGPKPKIDEIAEKQIYAALSVGASLNDAADMLMIDRTTIYRHKKKSKQFATGCMAAEKRGKIGHLNKIAKAKQWQASAWMMERKWGEEYGKNRLVIEGSIDSNVKLDVKGVMEQILTNSEIFERAVALADRMKLEKADGGGTNGNGSPH